MPKKVLTGIVINNKADKTISVQVERTYRHPIFDKIVKRRRKYAVHDPNNDCQIGDIIKIIESKPISKTKRFAFLEKLKTK